MAGLLIKRLAKMSIGTNVKLTYEDSASHLETVTGTVTDSDYSDSLELTLGNGGQVILDFSLIRGIEFVDAASVRTEQGGQPTQKQAAARQTPLAVPVDIPLPFHKQALEIDTLYANDMEIKSLFQSLPTSDRKKLSPVYDKFFNAIKNRDDGKKINAAHQAEDLLFNEENFGYNWDSQSARFCGLLLCRVNEYNSEVFRVGSGFWEAALCSYKNKKYIYAGADAVQALLNGGGEHTKDLFIILANCMIHTGDASFAAYLQGTSPQYQPYISLIIQGLFAEKNAAMPQNKDDVLKRLAEMYPKTDIRDEFERCYSGDAPGTEPAPEPASKRTPVQKNKLIEGRIKNIMWSNESGNIVSIDGTNYTFLYKNIVDRELLGELKKYTKTDMGGKTYWVRFSVQGNSAYNVQSGESPLIPAREAAREGRFQDAIKLYKSMIGTDRNGEVLFELVNYAVDSYTSNREWDALKEVEAVFRENDKDYPEQAKPISYLSQLYYHIGDRQRAISYSEKALAFKNQAPRFRAFLLSQHIRYCKDEYNSTGDMAMLRAIVKTCNEWEQVCQNEKNFAGLNKHYFGVLEDRFRAECQLGMLKEAEEDLARIRSENPFSPKLRELQKLLFDLKNRVLEKQEKRNAQKIEEQPNENVSSNSSGASEAASGQSKASEDDNDYSTVPKAEEDEDEDEIPVYEDTDGWEALGLTKDDVVGYALGIEGPERIPAMLVYLKAGSLLNKSLEPVYRTAALAANDPMCAPDYSITALLNALELGDPDYPVLNDYCMAAAFLRASFQSGKGYDYNAKSLRSSITLANDFPALNSVFDMLEEFRTSVERGIDIYADYRSHGVKQLKADTAETVRHAGELYTKYILNGTRENIRLARLIETRKIIFSKTGYLAVMLEHIMNQDQEALEEQKEDFVANYLNTTGHLSDKHISTSRIDQLIDEGWDASTANLTLVKHGTTLQGNLRNNLRSSIADILGVICRWYMLSEQSAGLTWRTQKGEETYQSLRPMLMEQLGELARDCDSRQETAVSDEESMGLSLLASAALELSARLDGSWSFSRQKYMYVDFLRSDNIMLGDGFMPELESTFCKLPEFNILARIRKHIEGPKMVFQEHIDQIYGSERVHNNYGSARLITQYMEDCGESVTAPENAGQFVAQTEMQIKMEWRSFKERYALSEGYGQIIKSDTFCHTLLDTVHYWYNFCRKTQNYGFFTSIIQQGEKQIHISARQYEFQLNKQLDAMLESNPEMPENNADYIKMIREQISQQYFFVAEDSMRKLRTGECNTEMQQPEALKSLGRFWSTYYDSYKRVADTGRTLGGALQRRGIHNKDTKRAQQLIDSWLSNGNASTPERITQLLNLLGWQNIRAARFQYAAEPRVELYRVCSEQTHAGPFNPLHPIAAFGSRLAQKGMYVACLYGTYDCERIMEKIRALDSLDGNKVVLVDYALSSPDRRTMARELKKKESGLRNVYMVIDRVMICYLADNYNENIINRTLMSVAMPFSYCQPYVADSSHTMPPEIFIGRKDELLKIEQPDGVNLIYGGRQLGKSALFKKARADIEGIQNKRAVFVDIKDCDCAAAARKLSMELIELNIVPDMEVTADWDTLCWAIRQQLRKKGDEISYLLVMLDEADKFIDDCSNYSYKPLAALKDVQQLLPEQFKFVLAGLHNIVRFNREVALGRNAVITHLPSLKITPFHLAEAQELLTVPLSYLGFSFPSDTTISLILATANYFPGLIQLYCQKLIESVRAMDYAGYDISKTPPYVVTDDHLRRIMADREFVEQIHEKFEITLRLDQDQGSFYYPIALLIGWMDFADSSKNSYSAADVLFHARDLQIPSLMDLDEEKIEALLQELQDLNILRSVSQNTYQLASKNFRDLLGSENDILNKLQKLNEGSKT